MGNKSNLCWYGLWLRVFVKVSSLKPKLLPATRGKAVGWKRWCVLWFLAPKYSEVVGEYGHPKWQIEGPGLKTEYPKSSEKHLQNDFLCGVAESTSPSHRNEAVTL